MHTIVFYRYGSICEPDILDSFQKIGLTVLEEKTEITQKQLSNVQRVQNVEALLKEHHPLFVFSVNFYPVIAEICKIYQTLYLCWTVDSPVPELFSSSIRCETNRVFLFDRGQYAQFHEFNPEHIYHLPLASATDRFRKVIDSITPSDRKNYSHDIAFVGSLYSEKNPLGKLKNLSQHTKGYIEALEQSTLKLAGCNLLEDTLIPSVIQDIKNNASDFYQLKDAVTSYDSYIVAHSYIGMDLAVKERIMTLNNLSQHFKVDLYTLSDPSPLQNVLLPKNTSPNNMANSKEALVHKGLTLHKGASSLVEMPKIFHLSKVNLNMTVKPIKEGLPLRIFDIMGCGGFCMTNFQPEIPEYFEIGTDLETYTCQEELLEKCAFYLEHEDLRQQVALNGYEKVCEQHTYFSRIKKMLSLISG